ncbi:MAG TPA: thioesterase family protein [Longimicrobiales bacterium]|nr:thioesterase family protein [Longimicrobiales bacterium]
MSTEPEFRFVYQVPVRFRDLDAMGHAHHSLPLVYIEEARAAYWRDVANRRDVASIDYIMAQVSVRYVRRIEFPATLRIGLRVSRLGGSSFTMQYEIRDAHGDLLATAETVQVMYDYEQNRSKSIPDDVRTVITAFERL